MKVGKSKGRYFTMKIEISAKNYTVSTKLQALIEKKVGKLDKYLEDDAAANIVCKQDGKICKLELNVRSKGMFYRSEVQGENMYVNIDVALAKVERQIVKTADKLKTKFRKGADFNADFIYFDEKPEEETHKLVKTKTFELEPISVEDAQIALENLDNNFYVFLNRETNNVNVIYKRNDGNYGVIEVVY